MYWIYIPTTLRLLVWHRLHSDVLNIYSNHSSSSCLAQMACWCTEYIFQPLFFFLSGMDYTVMYWIDIPTTLRLLVCLRWHADVLNIHSNHSSSSCLSQIACWCTKYVFQTIFFFFLSGSDYMLMYWIYIPTTLRLLVSDYMLMYWIDIPTTLRLLVRLRLHADVLNRYSNHSSSSCLDQITCWCTE